MKIKIPKWLKDAHSRYPNDEFFIQLHEQAPPLFEKMINKKIDWQKAWLFIEPINDKYIFHYGLGPVFKNVNRELVLMKCSLGSVNGNIGWYNNSGPETLTIHDEIGDRQLKFQLYDFDLRPDLFFSIPGSNVTREKKILTKVDDFNVYFEFIPHEGYIAIHFKEMPSDDNIELLRNILENGRNTWNTEFNKGLFHNIYFEEVNEERTALFYFDNGSAENGVFEFILQKLSGENLEIEKIEIIGH